MAVQPVDVENGKEAVGLVTHYVHHFADIFSKPPKQSTLLKMSPGTKLWYGSRIYGSFLFPRASICFATSTAPILAMERLSMLQHMMISYQTLKWRIINMCKFSRPSLRYRLTTTALPWCFFSLRTPSSKCHRTTSSKSSVRAGGLPFWCLAGVQLLWG